MAGTPAGSADTLGCLLSVGHAVEKGFTANRLKQDGSRERQRGRFAAERRRFFAEYRSLSRSAPRSRRPSGPSIYMKTSSSMSGVPGRSTLGETLFTSGTDTFAPNLGLTPGMLKPLRRFMTSDARFLERERGYRYLHYEGIYATSLFGHMVVRVQTITGARCSRSLRTPSASSS